MKLEIKRYKKHIIQKATLSENKLILIHEYRTVLYNYVLDKEEVFANENYKKYLRRFWIGTHDLLLITDNNNNFAGLESKARIILKGSAIDKYEEKEYEDVAFINYKDYNIFTQLDGITTIVGLTGSGKTWSALRMLPIYAEFFDKIAYLNYELPDRDIVTRFKKMYPDLDDQESVFEKLWIKDGIMTSLDLDEILDAMEIEEYEKVVFIIDNVGSVIGQEDNVYLKQNEFLKYLDSICKERGWHALALTQTVKDVNLKIFNESGEIADNVNTFIISGSVVLPNLSRSVLFTAYNRELHEFKKTTLKVGTGVPYLYFNNEQRGLNYVRNATKSEI